MRVRFPTAALIALTLVVGLLLASATLASGASPNNPKADIQSGNSFCGIDLPNLPVIGFANYHRTGNTVSFNYHLKGAQPNAEYRIELWGDFCTFLGIVTTVTTNGNGVANASGSMTVSATMTRFFATGLGPNGYNDTPAVELLP
jgi:hypothetical protein